MIALAIACHVFKIFVRKFIGLTRCPNERTTGGKMDVIGSCTARATPCLAFMWFLAMRARHGYREEVNTWRGIALHHHRQ
jgi:hypothetical protein